METIHAMPSLRRSISTHCLPKLRAHSAFSSFIREACRHGLLPSSLCHGHITHAEEGTPCDFTSPGHVWSSQVTGLARDVSIALHRTREGVQKCMYVCMYLYVLLCYVMLCCVCMYVCMYVCSCMSVCMYVCMCVCNCMYIYACM